MEKKKAKRRFLYFAVGLLNRQPASMYSAFLHANRNKLKKNMTFL